MDRICIRGRRPVEGVIPIGGAKNAALPLMAASLLTPETLILKNVPVLADIATMANLLVQHGVAITRGGEGSDLGHIVELSAEHITSSTAPYDLVRKMRASVLVLGPLVARCGRARVSLPGGCARAPRGLRGAEIAFPAVSVGATENLLMAAVLADGETLLINAAREPEITDLANCLVALGARIHGLGTDRLEMVGVARLHGTTHSVIPDRIETGTYIMAAAATNGEVRLTGTRLELVASVARSLEGAGVEVRETAEGVTVRRCA